MTAAVFDITIEQGATFEFPVTWATDAAPPVPIDLTGYTARMQVRHKYNSTDKLLDLTTENGGITLGGALGTILILATASQTAAVPAPKDCVYDLELVAASGKVTRLLQGVAVISPEVTK